MDERITLKGSRDGLRLILHPDAAWDEVLAALRKQLAQGNAFYQGARLLIDVGAREITDAELHQLTEVMQEYGIAPEALLTAAPPALEGIAESAAPVSTAEQPTPGLFVWRTVRSGQEIRHHGHVVVVGDVNAGAEIIASGSIIIWGRLRGVAHAGAYGDRRAQVCALELNPPILRIADQIARTPDNHRATQPEQASLVDDQIVVVPWDAPRR